MHHDTGLIAALAAGLGLAFLLGLAATRLRLPALVGYLLAGVIVGPFTPGFVADPGLSSQLAEIGVILLMFGVGIHFSLRDLLAVRRIAVPGALVQIAVATALGIGLARLWGWSYPAGLVFGLSLSVASTVVLLRALEARGQIESVDGRIAIGWLIVEDLVTVVALVLLPTLASATGQAHPETSDTAPGVLLMLGLTLGKLAVFVGLMFFVGRRVVPWLLVQVARSGSRELFTVAVLGAALGIAFGAAALFDVSFALGAFLAGVVVGESDLSHEAATDALPLQDAFGVLFFVAVGMLFDPRILVREPLQVLAALLIVTVGKAVAAAGIVLVLRYPLQTALTIAASLAQIGEFSFIVVALGVSLGLLPKDAQSLIVAVALLSITLNPLAFRAIQPVGAWLRARPRIAALLERASGALSDPPPGVGGAGLAEHVVVVGHGRVGGPVARALEERGIAHIVVDQNREAVRKLRTRGLRAIYGDAARPGILFHAHLERARLLVVATPDPLQARAIIQVARRANPSIEVVARTHSEEERAHLEQLGVSRIVLAEREAALAMTRHVLESLTLPP